MPKAGPLRSIYLILADLTRRADRHDHALSDLRAMAPASSDRLAALEARVAQAEARLAAVADDRGGAARLLLPPGRD